jgi:hypothetical protein
MGFQIRWYLAKDPNKRKLYDTIWHMSGWLVRFLVHLFYFIEFFHTIWYEQLLFHGSLLLFTWAGFDLAINWINKWYPYYIGHSKINNFVIKYIGLKLL